MKPYYKTNSCALYQCDNLDLLKSLPDNYVDLIYCDILYNTGRKFKDYDDNLGTPQEAITWYEPRLIEMKRILKETGTIYLHMDYRLVHYMKVKMDEIFGMENFINDIAWCYTGPAATKSYYPRKHDNILFFSKSTDYIFNQPRIKHKSGVHNTGQVFGDMNIGSVEVKKNLEEKGKKLEDWWIDIWSTDRYRKELCGYPTQKPKKLLERVIKASSNENDIVADFFMGSGTTGEVALELGRKFIGCDIGDKACKISKERIENIIK